MMILTKTRARSIRIWLPVVVSRYRLLAMMALTIGVAVAAMPISASAMRFADILVDHSPLGGNVPGDLATNVLGLPDGAIAQFQNLDPSTPGFVTVQFSGSPIVDEPGDDFFLHLIDWTVADNEPFEVFASLDGVLFESIGTSGPSNGPTGLPITLGFDLANASFSSASYLRVVNGRAATSCCEGPDIDAIAAIPEPSTALLLAAGLAGLAKSRRPSTIARI